VQRRRRPNCSDEARGEPGHRNRSRAGLLERDEPGAPIQRRPASEHRRDRHFHERFRCDVLAIEEVTAKLTASFVLADLSIAHHPRRDRAAYVASWLEVLKRGPRAIFIAASNAQRGADWLNAQQPDAARGRDA
jgi:antirestriction protein ArdC